MAVIQSVPYCQPLVTVYIRSRWLSYVHGNPHDAGAPILYHLAGRTGCAAFFSINGCMKAVPQNGHFYRLPGQVFHLYGQVCIGTFIERKSSCYRSYSFGYSATPHGIVLPCKFTVTGSTPSTARANNRRELTTAFRNFSRGINWAFHQFPDCSLVLSPLYHGL